MLHRLPLARYDSTTPTRIATDLARSWVAQYLFSKLTLKPPQMKLKVRRHIMKLDTQSPLLKVVRLNYLTSTDAALSPIAVVDIEISWW